MFDEVQALRSNGPLHDLLEHYGRLAATDREAWQDRVMEMEGVEARELVKLHGELIAFSWIEQNTGVTPPGKPGVVAGCYRITSLGQRALRRAPRSFWTDEDETEAA
jgi:hypothetical protein